MRQTQHGKKPRGRGRKPHNPLSRVYDSNGPDIKIRGSASHIADKYLTLARDAHSSGERIAAESYYQYAEHYLRIVAAAQAQMGATAAQNSEQPSSEGAQDQQGAAGAEHSGDDQSQPQSELQSQSQPQPQPQEQGEGRTRRSRGRRNGAARAEEQTGGGQQEDAQAQINDQAASAPADQGGPADEPAGNGAADVESTVSEVAAVELSPAPVEGAASLQGEDEAGEKTALSSDPLNA